MKEILYSAIWAVSSKIHFKSMDLSYINALLEDRPIVERVGLWDGSDVTVT